MFAEPSYWLDTLPWVKRRPRNKWKKQKWPNKRKTRKITDAFDYIRTVTFDTEENVSFDEVYDELEVKDPSLERINELENQLPNKWKMAIDRAKCGFCCDGAFGCT